MTVLKNLPTNVLRLLANKSEMQHAVRKYTIGCGCTLEEAYHMVIEEVSEHLDPDQQPWKPYDNFHSWQSATNRKNKEEFNERRANKVEHKRIKRK